MTVVVATSTVGRRELGVLLQGATGWQSAPVATTPAATADDAQAPTSPTPSPTEIETPTQAPTPTPTPAPTQAASPTQKRRSRATRTPAATSTALTGQWRGTLTQSQSPATLTVLVTLQGSSGGQIILPDIGCTGTLTVTRTLADRTVFHDLLTKDVQGLCARSGTVTITRLGANDLRLRWVNDAAPFNSATGVLQRG